MDEPRRPVVWYMAQGYPVRGGHEAHLLHYATEMRLHGFDTRVVVPDALPAEEHLFMRQLRARGIPLESVADSVAGRVRWRTRAVLPFWAMRQGLRGRGASPEKLRAYLSTTAVAAELSRKIERERPDILHVLGRLQDNLWDVLPAERTVFHHGTEGVRDASWEPDEAEHFRAFCERAALNFAPGAGVAENLCREFGIRRPIQTVFTICPDAAPPTAAPPKEPAGAPRFGILCRMIPEKGLGHLLDALGMYQERWGGVDFLFAGAGPLQEMVAAEIRRRALPGVRQQHDFPNPVDVLRNLDVFVHPSVSDAMPMAIAEALMCGLPCIVTRVGGIPDLVRDGVEGFVVEPGRPEDIAERMGRFAAMRSAERAEFRRRARARYEEVCRQDRVGSHMAGYYRTVLGGAGGAPGGKR